MRVEQELLSTPISARSVSFKKLIDKVMKYGLYK